MLAMNMMIIGKHDGKDVDASTTKWTHQSWLWSARRESEDLKGVQQRYVRSVAIYAVCTVVSAQVLRIA